MDWLLFFGCCLFFFFLGVMIGNDSFNLRNKISEKTENDKII